MKNVSTQTRDRIGRERTGRDGTGRSLSPLRSRPLFATFLLAALIGLPLSCDTGTGFLDGIRTEVMRSNKRFLEVTELTIPTVAESQDRVNPTSSFSIVFDRDINTELLEQENFLIESESPDGSRSRIEGLEAQYSWTPATRTLTLTFVPFLPINKTIILTLKDLMGTDGSRLMEPLVRSFVTRNILASSISSFENNKGVSDSGYTNSLNTKLVYQLNDLFPYYKYCLQLNNNALEAPSSFQTRSDSGHELEVNLASLSGGSDLSDGVHTIKMYFWGSNLNSGDNLTPGLTTQASITLDRVAPASPTVSATSPVLRPSWSWNEVESDAVYRTSLNSGSWSSWASSRNYNPGTLSDDTHILRVQARDPAGNISGEGSASVLVTPCLPLSGAIRVSRTPTLSWRAPVSGLSYKLEMTLTPQGQWVEIASELYSNTYTWPKKATPLLANKIFYWRVKGSRRGMVEISIPSTGYFTFTTGN